MYEPSSHPAIQAIHPWPDVAMARMATAAGQCGSTTYAGIAFFPA